MVLKRILVLEASVSPDQPLRDLPTGLGQGKEDEKHDKVDRDQVGYGETRRSMHRKLLGLSFRTELHSGHSRSHVVPPLRVAHPDC